MKVIRRRAKTKYDSIGADSCLSKTRQTLSHIRIGLHIETMRLLLDIPQGAHYWIQEMRS
jgi:hypothetical protein